VISFWRQAVRLIFVHTPANACKPKRDFWLKMISATPLFQFVLVVVGIGSLALLLAAVLLIARR
jgi:hypothetical protein